MKIIILLIILLQSNLLWAKTMTTKSKKFTLLVHGGAGTITKSEMTPEKEKAYKENLENALKAGYEILVKGGTALDAITASIKILEDCPLFNAGKGAVFTNLGTHELDASMMDGKTLAAGAVAGVKTVKNPILAARAVMEKSEHVMLAGSGADEFAKTQGLEIVENSYFYTKDRYDRWQKMLNEEKRQDKSNKKGTVGAVAIDQDGNLAAGTSTGGMTNKKFGRVGDSPIIGAGTYANNKTCAVSGTGWGEFFIRTVVAYDISALVQYKHLALQKATDLVISKVGKLGGDGGVIAIDNKGNMAMSFNTEGMYRGSITESGKFEVHIY